MTHRKVTLDKVYQFETGIEEGRRKERYEMLSKILIIIKNSEWIHPKLRNKVIQELKDGLTAQEKI